MQYRHIVDTNTTQALPAALKVLDKERQRLRGLVRPTKAHRAKLELLDEAHRAIEDGTYGIELLED